MLTPKITAILLMGGEGTRFVSPLPKQFHRINGRPIFLHTLEQFISLQAFHQILLAVPENQVQQVQQEVCKYPEVEVIQGGQTRQESSYRALQSCSKETDFVVIHDGVRPFVSHKILQENIQEVLIHQAVDTCIPSADTLVQTKKEHWIHEIPHRAEFLRGQTPQSFAFPIILKAHEKAIEDQITN